MSDKFRAMNHGGEMNYCGDCDGEISEFHYVEVSQDEYLDELESDIRATREQLTELENRLTQELLK